MAEGVGCKDLQMSCKCEECGCCVLCDRDFLDLTGVLISHVFPAPDM